MTVMGVPLQQQGTALSNKDYFEQQGLLFERQLGFDDLAGFDAAGADAHAFAAAFDLGLDRLEVWVPTAASGVVCVGDIVAELRAFAAELAFLCHDGTPIFSGLRRQAKC